MPSAGNPVLPQYFLVRLLPIHKNFHTTPLLLIAIMPPIRRSPSGIVAFYRLPWATPFSSCTLDGCSPFYAVDLYSGLETCAFVTSYSNPTLDKL
jgi:hypothetical protein